MARVISANKKIIEFRDRYYKVSAGKDALLKLVSEAEVAEQVYNSNAI